MNGHLQQIVALAINGNALRTGVTIDGFWPEGTAFVFDHETSFHVLRKRWFKDEWIKANPDPISWFAANEAGYRIHHKSRNDPNIPDRMASGFANGGVRWLIEAIREGKSSFWEGAMDVSHPNAIDRRIWTTRYYCVERDLPGHPVVETDLDVMRGQLFAALEAIHAFAARHGSHFASSFAEAMAELKSATPSPFGWKNDLLPAGFGIPLAARQLLASAQQASVFGAMGSWNDQYWPDAVVEAEYNEVSERLFACLNDAVVAATNSTYADR